jgi:hypothetical protein
MFYNYQRSTSNLYGDRHAIGRTTVSAVAGKAVPACRAVSLTEKARQRIAKHKKSLPFRIERGKLF